MVHKIVVVPTVIDIHISCEQALNLSHTNLFWNSTKHKHTEVVELNIKNFFNS